MGPDVVVSNGAASVQGLGGDDVICSTATVGNVDISAGPGADVIDRRGDTDPTAAGWIDPGEGADQAFGAPGGDGVTLEDTDRDLVSTGAGEDRVGSGLDWPDLSVQPDRSGTDFVWIRDIRQRERSLSLALRRKRVRARTSTRRHVDGLRTPS